MINIIENPFVIGGYVSRDFFCGRERERRVIMQELLEEHNIALISPRRMGKTSLLNYTFSFPDVKDEIDTIYADLINCKSLNDFATELKRAANKKLKERGSKINIPQRMSINGFMDFLNNNIRPVIICINNFDEIKQFKEKDIQNQFELLVMNNNKIRFIFAGSDPTTMEDIFISALNPFYKKATIVRLEPLKLQEYTEFSQHLFELGNKHVTSETIAELYRRFDGITWYLQVVLHTLYNMTPANAYCEDTMIEPALKQIIDNFRFTFEDLYKHMTTKQKTSTAEDLLFRLWLDSTINTEYK